jgi:hypothetical protein
MLIRRLDDGDDDALQELLLAEPTTNLFLLSTADDPALSTAWVGAFDGEILSAVVFALGGLLVPAGDAAAMPDLASAAMAWDPPGILVGPREAADALATALPSPRTRVDQRLYVARTAAIPPSGALEPARAEDVDVLAEMAAAMNREDLGREVDDWDRHRTVVRGRIDRDRVFVIREAGTIVFTVNVGTRHRHGCQIGGTYVPPSHRGRGLATRGMADLVHRLLERHPVVTLHVREANPAAIAVYERVGFVRDVPYRVLTW